MNAHKASFALMFCLTLALAFPTGHVSADPCGMVPPIYTGPGSPIARTGLQQTYVFFDQGVESFVIRPAFTGKVDNFGMLIPFPSPPAIRKVADNVFDQIKNETEEISFFCPHQNLCIIVNKYLSWFYVIVK